MVESILRSCGYKTGLFTSPHLIDVRERIRINGSLVEQQLFMDHFWACHDELKAKATEEVGVPGYFRFMTLLALKVFEASGLDVVILEVGIGGRLDATNVIKEPVVCGITSLGMDHMEMLGNTIGLIASEKAGIMKHGCPAFSSPQVQEAAEALISRASCVGTTVQFTPSLHDSGLKSELGIEPALALGGHHMNMNAGLAVKLAIEWEQRSDSGRFRSESLARSATIAKGILPQDYIKGLESVEWPGRSQIVESEDGPNKGLRFYIDGAHTPESMVACADWFSDESISRGSELQRVLLFNCMKERDPAVLLPILSQRLQERGIKFHQALFVPPESQYSHLQGTVAAEPQGSELRDLSWQIGMKSIWEERSLGSQPSTVIPIPSLPLAIEWLRNNSSRSSKVHILCTGSLYLVGDLLRLLKRI